MRVGVQTGSWFIDNENEWNTFLSDTNNVFFTPAYFLLLNSILNQCPANSIFCGYYTASWGGKVNDIPANETAFFHRGVKVDISILAYYNFEDEQLVEENEMFMTNLYYNTLYLNGLTTNRGYCNYISDTLTQNGAYLDYYYGENLERLIDIKCNYDPDNYFTNRQGLPTDTC